MENNSKPFNYKVIFLVVVGVAFTFGFGFLIFELASSGKGAHTYSNGRGIPGNYLGSLITFALVPVVIGIAWVIKIKQKRSGKYEDD